VPPSASLNTPSLRAMAPVNEPFSWPNSSLSSSDSGMAPQWTGMKGASLRELSRWTASATSSLPVPLSPWMSTVEWVPATFLTISNTGSMAAEWPMMFGNAAPSAAAGPSGAGAATSRRPRRWSSDLRMTWSISSMSKGFLK